MANIVIEDLEMNEDLDKKAMQKVIGGWWVSQSSSMGWSSGPWGSVGWSSSQTSWGSGWGWNPVPQWGRNPWPGMGAWPGFGF